MINLDHLIYGKKIIIFGHRNVAWDDAEKSNVLTTNQDQSAFKWQGNKNT